jgi:phosphosulfolactate synthase (CoM biosynthesis protein A)
MFFPIDGAQCLRLSSTYRGRASPFRAILAPIYLSKKATKDFYPARQPGTNRGELSQAGLPLRRGGDGGAYRACGQSRKGAGVTERGFQFLGINEREGKPRGRGITEIRGPYYTPMGPRYLSDILQTMGEHVDSLKFAGGAFTLMPHQAVKEIINLAHSYEVTVSTGGFMEYVLTQGREAVEAYIRECRGLGFDTIEISAGFISIPTDDWLRLVEKVQEAGLRAKPEVGIQFGAGGATTPEELEGEGTRDPQWLVEQAGRFLEAGAYMVMIESEGITESVESWRTEVPARIINSLGLESVMFEAADPEVFEWYVKNYGPEVNLFVDHSQIVQLECLRRGIWGTKSTWGRVLTYKG